MTASTDRRRDAVLLIGVLLILALLSLAAPAGAIEQEAGIRFLVANPTGDFDREVDDLGFGLGAHWGVRPDPAFSVGFGAHVAIYGSETTAYDLPLVEEFELETTNNLAGGFLFAQYRPFRGPVQPYAEGRLGVQYLWTQSELQDADWWDDDGIARETNWDDWATFWSAGGGLLIQLSGGDADANRPGVLLDLKATYQRGSEAEYLAEGAIEIVDDQPVFSVSESATHLMAYEVGVVLTF